MEGTFLWSMKGKVWGDGEMGGSGLCGERAYHLRALDALPEDMSLIPKPHLRCSQSPVPSVPGVARDSGFCK